MILDLHVHLHYQMPQITDLLVQIEAPDLADQLLLHANIKLSETEHFARVAAENGLGERIWLRVEGEFVCDYTAKIQVERPVLDLKSMAAVSPHRLPGDTIRYLMPSRYCPADLFQNFVLAEFGTLEGGARIAAMRDWIEAQFQYTIGSSTDQTSALDTFVKRQGICRDFAHVLITLARASAIPARFASVYAPGVEPQDFHAVAEVYLEGTWHLVDATGMATADTIARIGVGLDAADVAFMTSFGPTNLVEQSVTVEQSPAIDAV
jgi:transglutaminase-like putative cysteine protease